MRLTQLYWPRIPAVYCYKTLVLSAPYNGFVPIQVLAGFAQGNKGRVVRPPLADCVTCREHVAENVRVL